MTARNINAASFAPAMLSEGKAEGKAEGEVAGKIAAILSVLEARGLAISEEQKQRVHACTEIEVLDRWIRRAATASSADELFA